MGARRRPTTNMLSTDQYKEIIFTKDDELIGLRFLQPVGAVPGFEVNLFISKKDGLGEGDLPLLSRNIHWLARERFNV